MRAAARNDDTAIALVDVVGDFERWDGDTDPDPDPDLTIAPAE